jgi:hypothetical protein
MTRQWDFSKRRLKIDLIRTGAEIQSETLPTDRPYSNPSVDEISMPKPERPT